MHRKLSNPINLSASKFPLMAEGQPATDSCQNTDTSPSPRRRLHPHHSPYFDETPDLQRSNDNPSIRFATHVTLPHPVEANTCEETLSPLEQVNTSLQKLEKLQAYLKEKKKLLIQLKKITKVSTTFTEEEQELSKHILHTKKSAIVNSAEAKHIESLEAILSQISIKSPEEYITEIKNALAETKQDIREVKAQIQNLIREKLRLESHLDTNNSSSTPSGIKDENFTKENSPNSSNSVTTIKESSEDTNSPSKINVISRETTDFDSWEMMLRLQLEETEDKLNYIYAIRQDLQETQDFLKELLHSNHNAERELTTSNPLAADENYEIITQQINILSKLQEEFSLGTQSTHVVIDSLKVKEICDDFKRDLNVNRGALHMSLNTIGNTSIEFHNSTKQNDFFDIYKLNNANRDTHHKLKEIIGHISDMAQKGSSALEIKSQVSLIDKEIKEESGCLSHWISLKKEYEDDELFFARYGKKKDHLRSEDAFWVQNIISSTSHTIALWDNFVKAINALLSS